jgi:EAL and modified HD-GYP domain-containing signal transduction protein
MSATAQPGPAERPDAPAAPVFISRQPVLDEQRRVTGYRIAYSTPAQPTGAAELELTGEGAATRLFGDILSVVGLEELVGSSLAHLPISGRLLRTLGVPPVRPDRVVLRVAHADATEPDLQPILSSLAGRGYTLSLYDLPAAPLDPPLLETFGIVEIDPVGSDPPALARTLAAIAGARATPLAVGLRSEADFELAQAFGCVLFTGPFFASPRTTEVRDVPVGGLSTLAAVAGVQGAGGTIEELERVIDRDLGLSVKLLRYINSAYFGMRSNITSIRQAVMMLGARGVSRWALMVALTGGTQAPPELSVMALTRARMCELLAAGRADVGPDEMFLTGLLSLADALLDTPLDRVLEELPLADEIAGALLERRGPAGEILDAVISYEIGSFGSDSVRAHSSGVASAYIDALRWARETVQGLG